MSGSLVSFFAASATIGQAAGTAPVPPVAPSFRDAVLLVIVTGLFALVGALVGAVTTGSYARRNIERQIAAQEKNNKEQLEAALQGQLRQFKAEIDRRKEDEDRKVRSLVIAVAVEVIIVAARTDVYSDQVAAYTELTDDNIERLRITLPEPLNLEWQHAYLLVTPKTFGQIKKLTTIIERANRRLNQLQSFLKTGNASVVAATRFKPQLEDLASVYRRCAQVARETIGELKDEFPEFAAIIDDADNDLRFSRTRFETGGGQTEDGELVTIKRARNPSPFGSNIEP